MNTALLVLHIDASAALPCVRGASIRPAAGPGAVEAGSDAVVGQPDDDPALVYLPVYEVSGSTFARASRTLREVVRRDPAMQWIDPLLPAWPAAPAMSAE